MMKPFGLVQLVQSPDRPVGTMATNGPIVAMIHGLWGRAYLRDHLLRLVREEACADTTMFGHMHSVDEIANELEQASRQRREIVIIGYSLGRIPSNVAMCMNFVSEADFLARDRRSQDNLAIATSAHQRVENYIFPKSEKISHMGLTKCYPKSSVHPMVRSELSERIVRTLLSAADTTPLGDDAKSPRDPVFS